MLQIELDFKKLHPGKDNVLIEKWPLIKDHIINLLRASNISKHDRQYLDLLPSLISGIFFIKC